MELGDSLIRTVSALAVVLGLLAACAVVVRRVLTRRSPAGSGAPLVQVLGGGYLGGRKSIVVVAIAGEVLILGATETDLIPLGRVSDPERVWQGPPHGRADTNGREERDGEVKVKDGRERAVAHR